MHWPFQVDEALRSNKWYQALPARQREVLALAAMDKERDPDIRFADIYHSANRYATSGQSRVPVVLPRSTMWDFTRGRLLVGCLSEIILLH